MLIKVINCQQQTHSEIVDLQRGKEYVETVTVGSD